MHTNFELNLKAVKKESFEQELIFQARTFQAVSFAVRINYNVVSIEIRVVSLGYLNFNLPQVARSLSRIAAVDYSRFAFIT